MQILCMAPAMIDGDIPWVLSMKLRWKKCSNPWVRLSVARELLNTTRTRPNTGT